MPGKPRYTVDEVAAALVEAQGFMFLAAKKLGCSVKTLQRYRDRSSVVREAFEQKRGELIDQAELKLYQAVMEGQRWAVCFLLKTRAKDRGYTERVETSNVTEREIEQAVVEFVRLTDSERAKALDRIVTRLEEPEKTGDGSPAL